MANLGDVSVLNINGNEMTIKDAAVREVVNEIIEAIGANNSNIAERINNLHNRSFDYTIKISSNNESEIASIQDGLYKIQYVTITQSGDDTIETLNNSAIMIQKGTNQYLFKDGSILIRTKTNNTWGEWDTSETQLSKGTTSGNGNAVTDISVSNHQITLEKNLTFLTTHQSIKTLNNQTLIGDGNINILGLPVVTASDNGKILMVINGVWTLTAPSVLYSGSGIPNNANGNNGDLFMQTD